MEAYEFYATPENGSIIIPEQYRKKIKSGVKVILLNQTPRNTKQRKAKPKKKSDMLLPPILEANGWTFDREEANAR